MSKISLKHSGGNVVSLNSPTNAPSASDVAFKLPNADGSAGQFMKTDGSGNLSFDAAGGGKILQVVEADFSTSYQSGSTSFVDVTNASITITPSNSNNKILVMVNLDADYAAQTADLRVIYTQLLRGSSTVVDKKAYYLGHGVSSTSGYNWYAAPIDMLTLDSPGVNTAVTYKVQAKTDSGNNNALFRVNMVTGQCTSRLIAMEVAA